MEGKWTKVDIGDDELILFDPVSHIAQDREGQTLLSGSVAEHLLSPEFSTEVVAKKTAEKYDLSQEDVLAVWDAKRTIASSYGTFCHTALELWARLADSAGKMGYDTYEMFGPETGRVVDNFYKTVLPDHTHFLPEVRIKHGMATGVVDLLAENMYLGGWDIFDYKFTPEIRNVNFKGIGKYPKYTVQQNFYREILEREGKTISGMHIAQYYHGGWIFHEVERVDVLDKALEAFAEKNKKLEGGVFDEIDKIVNDNWGKED